MMEIDFLKLLGVSASVYVILLITYNFLIKFKSSGYGKGNGADNYLFTLLREQNSLLSKISDLQNSTIHVISEMRSNLDRNTAELHNLSHCINELNKKLNLVTRSKDNA